MRFLIVSIIVIGTGIGGLVILNRAKDLKAIAPLAPLRVAYRIEGPLENYDPARIDTLSQAILIDNIYSPLIELDNEGRVQPGLAQSYRWEDRKLILSLREGMKTLGGVKLGAEDAKSSLLRLISKGNNNTHGNLGSFLDEKNPVSIEKGELVLLLKDESKRQFILPLLANPDFSVIPLSSLAEDGKILDHYNTSGPYAVSDFESFRRIVLKANPNHYHYSDRIPQEIHLIHIDDAEVPSALEEGFIDMVPTAHTVSPAVMDKFVESRKKDFQIHRTQDIRLVYMRFSPAAVDRLSRQERLGIGAQVRRAYFSQFDSETLYKKTSVFFSSFGEARLSSDEVKQIENRWEEHLKFPIGQKISFASRPDQLERNEKLFSSAPSVEVKAVPFAPWTYPRNEQPDAYLSNTDVGFNEDISLLSHYVTMEAFGMSKDEGEQWLEAYLEMESKQDRIEALRKLHLKMISEGIVVPLVVSPYIAIVRKPWTFDFPSLFVWNYFWKLRLK